MSLLGDQISVSASLGVWASRDSRVCGFLGFLCYDEQGGMLSGCRKMCLPAWKARLEISSRLGSCSHFWLAPEATCASRQRDQFHGRAL